MSKSNKFQRVNIAIGTPSLNLPSAPATRDPNVVYDSRGFPARDFDDPRGPRSGDRDRGGFSSRDRGDGPRRADRDGEEPYVGAGDQDNNWRRGPSAPAPGPLARGGGGAPPMGRHTDREGEDSFAGGASDQDNNWRRGPSVAPGPLARGGGGGGLASGVPPRSSTVSPQASSTADMSSTWRSGARNQSIDSDDRLSASGLAPKTADLSHDWRSQSAPPSDLSSHVPLSMQPVVHEADVVDNWRAVPRETLPGPGPAAAAGTGASGPPPIREADTVSDWRSVRVAQPPAPAPRAPPVVRPADVVDDWRSVKAVVPPEPAVPFVARRTEHTEDWRSSGRKRTPDGAHVSTPYGAGVLKQTRNDGIMVVSLVSGGTAYLRHDEVKPTHSSVIKGSVVTPYGKGVIRSIRHNDLVFVVDLPFAVAYLRAEDVHDVSSHRRFGDSERDRERESAFSRSFARNKPSSGAPAGGDAPAVFNAFNQNRVPRAGGPPLHARPAFPAAFGSDSRVPRMEEKRALGAGADSYSASALPSSEGEEPPRRSFPFGGSSQPQEDRRPFPAVFGGGSGAPRGPPRVGGAFDTRGAPSSNSYSSSSAFSTSSSLRSSDQSYSSGPSARREMPSAFGGDQRITRPATATASGGAFGVPSLRTAPLSLARQEPLPASSTQPAPQQQIPASSAKSAVAPDAPAAPAAPAAVPAAQQPRDEEASKQAPAASASAGTKPVENVKQPDPIVVSAGMKSLIKEYQLGEDKATAVKAVKALRLTPGMQPSLVVAAAGDLSTVKARKLVFALVLELHKNKLITDESLLAGLGEIKDVENARLLLAMLEEKIASLASASAPAGLRAGKTLDENSTGDLSACAKAIVSSGLGGSALVDMVKEKKWVLPGMGVVLLQALLPGVSNDDKCAWLDKQAYGPLLAVLLYKSDKDHMAALNAVQEAFDVAGFPKGASGTAVIDAVFTKLFTAEVLPDKAFIKWQQDTDSTVRGRTKAVIQTTRFFNWLEEDGEEEEDDD